MSMIELIFLTQLVYHEGRGEPVEGQHAIVYVVLTRAELRGESVMQVITDPKQFAFIDTGGDMPPITDHTALAACAASVEYAVSAYARGAYPAKLHGADHYHSVNVKPSWAAHMVKVAEIGNHIFYRSAPGLRRLR